MKRDKWFREDNMVRMLYPEVLLQHMLDETPNQIRKTVAWSHMQCKMMRISRSSNPKALLNLVGVSKRRRHYELLYMQRKSKEEKKRKK